MKKSNFVAMILGTIGTVFFALGMCMSLLPEWDMMRYCPYLILEAITQEQHNLCSDTDIKTFSPFSDSSTCCQFQYYCMIYKIKKPQAQYLRLLSCFFLPLNV